VTVDDPHLYEFLLRQGDNALVLGHRTSEWCGHAPALEEDIALANIALDLIGQTQLWLAYAADIEDWGRSNNDLAYLRDVYDFRNLLMLELPNEDFGRTIVKHFLFDAFQVPWLTALQQSSDQRVSDIAHKSLKEALYHLERSTDTVVALGDGTELSHERIQSALEYLWPYCGELFVDDDTDNAMHERDIAPLPSSIREEWNANVTRTFATATLQAPQDPFAHTGGRNGQRHTEYLGHMLATMQVLQRSYPGAKW